MRAKRKPAHRRTRPGALFTLSPAAIARLIKLAEQMRLPRSRVVEHLIFAARLEEP